MWLSRDKAVKREATGSTIWNYMTPDTPTSISVSYAELRGLHPESINKNSDRCYIFIKGTAKVWVEEESYQVSEGDVVYVGRGKRHSLEGEATYYVINNPPYRKQ